MSDDTASEDRKYPKTYTLAQLQTALRNDEPWWGGGSQPSRPSETIAW